MKKEIAKILEWHNSGSLNTDAAVEKIENLLENKTKCRNCGEEVTMIVVDEVCPNCKC